MTGCADFGDAGEIAALKAAVESAAWITEVAGPPICVQFNLTALEAYHSAHSVDECEIKAVIAAAGPPGSERCDTQNGGDGLIAVCRESDDRDVSNVSLCLCCTVTRIG